MQYNNSNYTPINSENSFLVETTYNSDIDENLRKSIEKRYRNSKSNKSYIFPRQGLFEPYKKPRNLSSPRKTRKKPQNSLPGINMYLIYSREIISLNKL
jgi:hypothetical protein